MAQSQFCLSWDAHKRNICTGLSALQQSGEFVDMTLAADGHLVKVHQVILALASPYIKELIATANCPHPVILLNKMSYNTLSSILEYIYTGEVVVSIENFNELVNAAKELHIKGLEDMDNIQSAVPQSILVAKPTNNVYEPVEPVDNIDMEEEEDEYCYFEVAPGDPNTNKVSYYQSSNSYNDDKEIKTTNEFDDHSFEEVVQEEVSVMQQDNTRHSNADVDMSSETQLAVETVDPESDSSKIIQCEVGMMQYTVSNQGSLQMILNRFVYYLKHTNRDGSRQWRCVDYLAHTRCPAIVITRDDVVTQRISSHLHPFHDKKILKKVRSGAVFSAIKDAVLEGENKKNKMPSNKDDKNIQIQS